MADLAKQLGVTVYQVPQNNLPTPTRLLQTACLIGTCNFVEDRLDTGVRYLGGHISVDYKTSAEVPGSKIPTSSIVDKSSVVVNILTTSGFTPDSGAGSIGKLSPVIVGTGTPSGADLATTSHVIASGTDGNVSGSSTFTSTSEVTFTSGMVGKYITYMSGAATLVSRQILAVIDPSTVTLTSAPSENLSNVVFVVSSVKIGDKLYFTSDKLNEYTISEIHSDKLILNSATTISSTEEFKVFSGIGCIVENEFIRLTSGLPYRGLIHISYIASRHDLTGKYVAASTVDDLKSTFGKTALSPDNPLGYGMFKCIVNAGELYTIYGVPISADTTLEHASAIDIIETNCYLWNTYFIIPLTFNETICQQYHEFVSNMNEPQQRFAMVMLWTPKLIYKDVLVYSGTGVISLDRTKLEDADLSPNFLELGVSEGHLINIIGPDGSESLARENAGYMVGSVAAKELTLANGATFAEAAGESVNYEIVIDWFQGTSSTAKMKQAQALRKYAETKGDEHFWINFPDYFVDNGFENHNGETVARKVPGYFANCSYVGSLIRMQPQQPLNNLRLGGYIAADHSNNYFKQGFGKHIHIIESGGIAVATQPTEGSSFVFLEQWTSRMDDQVYQYRSVIRNRDSAKMIFIRTLCAMIGKDNLTDNFRSKFSRAATVILQRLKEAGQAGPRAAVSSVEYDPNDRTNIKVRLSLDEPYPAHTADIYFMI